MLGKLLALGVAVYWLKSDGHTLKHYEETFVKTYGSTFANQVIPSDFRPIMESDPRLVARLCHHNVIRRSLTWSRPQIETHDITFPKLHHQPPLIAEVVRCSRNTAIIQAPSYNGHECAYHLQIQHKNRKPHFHIERKFCYIHNHVKKVDRATVVPEESVTVNAESP